jgi:hypothetical protein
MAHQLQRPQPAQRKWGVLRVFLTLVGVVLGGFAGILASGFCFG